MFNGQWSDIATEKTIIKDLKGSRGIFGLTNQKPALLRWTFTRHILGRFSSEMKTRSGLSSSTEKDHEENRPTAMKRDEEHMHSLIDHVKNNMNDLFDVEACPKDRFACKKRGRRFAPELC